jgi:dihydrodipicolinate reductase
LRAAETSLAGPWPKAASSGGRNLAPRGHDERIPATRSRLGGLIADAHVAAAHAAGGGLKISHQPVSRYSAAAIAVQGLKVWVKNAFGIFHVAETPE